jgi:hypothetical protein
MMELQLTIIVLQVIAIMLVSWNLWRDRGRFQKLQRMVVLMRLILNGESGSYWNHQLKELADIERELP